MTLLDSDRPRTSGRQSEAPARTTPWLASAGLAVSLFAGTSAHTAFPLGVRVEVAGVNTGTGGFAAPVPQVAPSTAKSIRHLRGLSGLSWDQLARVFGVSRRSVHKWANGGALNARHVTRLAYLTQLFAQLGDDPATVHALLLAPDEHGTTLYQQLVRQVRPVTDRPEGFSIDELVGARRDGDTTVLGDLLDAEHVDWPTAGS